MNIIYLHTHDTGRWIEPYHSGVKTPNLMKLAKEGTVFRNAYCCGPTCSPSRSALLTGEYPHTNGMLGLAHRGFGLNDYSHHLANYLKTQGYETALFGMQHEAKRAEDIGYDLLYIDPDRNERELWDVRNGEQALAYLRKNHKKPFFLSYGLEGTHKPYPHPTVDDRYVSVPSCLPDTAMTRHDFAGFLTSASLADACLGKILAEVKALGMEDNTLILYTTDHGVALPHMKCTLYDTGIGVALILKCPGHTGAGEVSDSLVSQLDIFPTICELVGLPAPPWLQGVSLVPILSGERQEVREEVFSEVNYHATAQPMRCIRTKRYKYIKRYGGEDTYLPANIDSGESKEFLLDVGLLNWKIPERMLYDTYLDPAERRNLVGEAGYEKLCREMEERLQRVMRESGDFVENEGLSKPYGAIVNRPQCMDADSTDPADYE